MNCCDAIDNTSFKCYTLRKTFRTLKAPFGHHCEKQVFGSGCVLCFYVAGCRGRCGEAFSRGQICTCDDDCLTHNECCKDYEEVCTSRKADLVLFHLINTVSFVTLYMNQLFIGCPRQLCELGSSSGAAQSH